MKMRLEQNIVLLTIEDPATVAEMETYFKFLEENVYSRKIPFVVIHDKRPLLTALTASHRWGLARHLTKHAFFLKKYFRGVATVVRPENLMFQQAAEQGLRWQVSLPWPTMTTSSFEEAFTWAQRLWWAGGRVANDGSRGSGRR